MTRLAILAAALPLLVAVVVTATILDRALRADAQHRQAAHQDERR